MSKLISLSAGHGLKTSGKQTPDGIKEWTLNDKVRDKVVAMLADYDVEFIFPDNDEGMTDESNSSRRSMYVNAKADAAVAIHHNANTGTWNNATGVETYVDRNHTSKDMELAQCIHKRLPSYTGLRDRGIKKANFTEIYQNNVPAVLTEGGFMDGKNDYPVITSDVGQTGYARAVAEGLVEFLKLEKKSGSSAEPEKKPEVNTENPDSYPATPFQVTVLVDDLNYRSQPSMNGTVKGQTGKGKFTIVEVQNDWGKLKSGAGWIYLANSGYCAIEGVAASKQPEQTETKNEEPDFTAGLQAKHMKNMTESAIVASVGPLCTADQKNTGVLASVSAAQFILESGYAKSELAQNANNCFGMKESLSGNTWAGSVWDGSVYTKETAEWNGSEYITVKANFRKYKDIEASVADHSAYLTGAMNGKKKRYEGLVGCADPRTAFQIIKNGGYATSPDYVDKLMAVVDKWNLTQYDLPVSEKPAEKVENKTEQLISYPTAPFLVTVLVDDLNYRSEPSMNGKVKGQTGKGKFTVTEVYNDWGRLKSGVGWIYLANSSYCTIGESSSSKEDQKVPFTVKVDIPNLNIRTGAGTAYVPTGTFTGKGKFTIVEVREGQGSKSGWGRLKSGAGWISLDYAERV